MRNEETDVLSFYRNPPSRTCLHDSKPRWKACMMWRRRHIMVVTLKAACVGSILKHEHARVRTHTSARARARARARICTQMYTHRPHHILTQNNPPDGSVGCQAYDYYSCAPFSKFRNTTVVFFNESFISLEL